MIEFNFVRSARLFNKLGEQPNFKTNQNPLRSRAFSTKLHCPAKVYDNPDLQKKDIINENKGKSGVYRWVNKVNGKTYVGSSVNLSRRLKNYYSLNLMGTKIKLGQSAIYSAILKYGHSNFKLVILEYCDSSDVIEREKYYFNLLRPKYNLLPTAGS
jgi:hypothetical protein